MVPTTTCSSATVDCRRVLHFIDSGGFYGAEKVITCLAQEMQRKGAFEPIVGCIVRERSEPVALFNEAQRLGIPSVRIPINNWRLPSDLVRAASEVKKMGATIIHSHGYKPSVFGYAIGRMTGIPVLATCHLWYPGASPPLKYRVMTWMEIRLYRYFRRVVCVSQQIQGFLISNGIAQGRLEIINNGINMEDYVDRNEVVRNRVRRSLSLQAGDFAVLNVARLTEQKGQKWILDVAEMMTRDDDRTKFLIAGEGEDRRILESMISTKGLGGKIRLLGFREDIADLLKAADAFFLPSLDEGLPMSLLEAMASGVPVVATPVGAIPQVIANGCNGLLVHVGDLVGMQTALERVQTDTLLRQNLARNALQTIRTGYSSETMYHRYEQIYRELTSTMQA